MARRKYRSSMYYRGGFIDPKKARSGYKLYRRAKHIYDTNPAVKTVLTAVGMKAKQALGNKVGETITVVPGGVFSIKRKIANATVTNDGVSLSRSRYEFGKPSTSEYTKIFKRSAQKQIVANSHTHRLTAGQGLQGVYSRVFSANSYQQQNQNVSISTSGDWSRAAIATFSGTGNTNLNTDTASIAPFGSDAIGKLLASTTTVTTKITSSSTINQTLLIYELVSKVSVLGASPTYAPSNYTVYRPDQLFQNGIDSMYVSGTSTSYLQQNMNPNYSQQFRDMWAIDKKYTVTLPAGASHVHTSKYNQDVYLSNFIIERSGWQQGVGRALMFILLPTPVHGTDAGVANNTLTTGEGAVDIVHQSYSVAYAQVGNTVQYIQQTAAEVLVSDTEAYSDIDIEGEAVDIS